MQLKNTIIKNLMSKKIYIFFILFFVGVLLLMLGGRGTEKNEESGKNSAQNLDPSEYVSFIEDEIEELCNRVDGVSGTYAVVTLKGGFQAIYATDEQKTNSGNKNQTVIIGSGSDEQAILRGYQYPEIAGIGIVCRGGDSYEIKNKIVTLISSTFNLSANKIFVVGS